MEQQSSKKILLNTTEVKHLPRIAINFEVSEEPVLMLFNEAGFNSEVSSYTNLAIHLQEIIELYQVLNFPTLNTEEFKQLISDPVCFVFDKLTGGQAVSIAGLSVNKHKAIEILEKPEGYELLIQKIDFYKKKGFEFHSEIRGNVQKESLLTVAADFELVDGELKLTEDKIEKIKKHFEVYATSQRAKKMYYFITSIISMAKELGFEDEFKGNPNGLGHVIRYTIGGDHANRFELSEKHISFYNDPSFAGRF